MGLGEGIARGYKTEAFTSKLVKQISKNEITRKTSADETV